jgi:hypothetical protein
MSGSAEREPSLPRGMLTGHGHLVHFAVVTDPGLFPEGERVARRGDEVLISANSPVRPSTDSKNKPVPNQSRELHRFAEQEAMRQALETGEPRAPKRPSFLGKQAILDAMEAEGLLPKPD